MNKIFLTNCIFFCISVNFFAQHQDFPKLTGPYLGQKPPGMTPELFAPGIVSTQEHEYGISFSPDGREIYLKRSGKNLVFVCESGAWGAPREVPFAQEGKYGEIHLTPDGKYLLANRITQEPDGTQQSTIVRFTRENGAWASPFEVGPGMRATSTGKGDIYVTVVLDSQQSLGAIGRYKFTNGRYGKVEILKGEINVNHVSSSHPFIAADESYLIFGSKRGNDVSGSLYVSFKRNDGSWSQPANLSKRLDEQKNTNHWIATVSPDGKYLFYNAGSDIYWVSAKIIETVRGGN